MTNTTEVSQDYLLNKSNIEGPTEVTRENEELEREPQSLREVPLEGWLTLAGGVLIHLVIGNVLLWGNISHYVISYLHYHGDPAASDDKVVVIFPISLLV